MADQARPLGLAEAFGAFLKYCGEWLRGVGDLVLALIRPTNATANALVAILLAKGIISEQELEAAKRQAAADFLIESTVGDLGQALETHFATFHLGALQALKAVTRHTDPEP